MAETTGPAEGGPVADRSATNVAVALAAATVLAMVVLGAADADGPIWLIQGALALATVVAAWRAGGTSTRNPLAMGALIVGAVLLAVFAGFAISEA
jgi:hypothetical protein